MPLIDNEKAKMKEIAIDQYQESLKKNYLKNGYGNGSYYVAESEGQSYLEEYEFTNPVELNHMLKDLFDRCDLSDELLSPVVVATFKLRDTSESSEKLPENIYSF